MNKQVHEQARCGSPARPTSRRPDAKREISRRAHRSQNQRPAPMPSPTSFLQLSRTTLLTHQLSNSCSHLPITPFLATHLYPERSREARNPPVTPFPATHTKSPSCKSFACHTSEKTGGWRYYG